MKKLRIGVIYGGRSGEHEVSVASAASIIKHLDRSRYEPIPIRIEKDGRWTLAEKAPTSISAADVIEHGRLESDRSRDSHRRRPRRRVPGTAWPVRRRWHRAGAARARERAVCGRRRARIRG